MSKAQTRLPLQWQKVVALPSATQVWIGGAYFFFPKGIYCFCTVVFQTEVLRLSPVAVQQIVLSNFPCIGDP